LEASNVAEFKPRRSLRRKLWILPAVLAGMALTVSATAGVSAPDAIEAELQKPPAAQVAALKARTHA
jgi:hypothetical protein